MGTYGRNFEFRIPPDGDERYGRYCVPSTGNKLPIGVPVKATTNTANALGLQQVLLATGEQAPGKSGCGIAVYEYGPAAYAGVDPYLVTYSDRDTIPLGAAIQVVHHPGIKVVFTNTTNTAYVDFTATFQSGPRIMVNNAFAATPNISVGSYLTPGIGDDTNGYYQITTTAANAWFVVTKVDSTRLEVEAEMTF